MKSPGLMG